MFFMQTNTADNKKWNDILITLESSIVAIVKQVTCEQYFISKVNKVHK